MTVELRILDEEPETDILFAEQCPLCGRFIIDGYIPKHGGASCRRFVVRYDLGGQAVCRHCDRELGPDQGRIEAMALSPNAEQMIAEYLAKHDRGSARKGVETMHRNPLAYYCWLRKTGIYSPRGAYGSTLMYFCSTEDELLARLRKRRERNRMLKT